MVLNDRPNLIVAVLFFVAGVLLGTSNSTHPAIPPLTWAAFGLAAAWATIWFVFQIETARLWRNTANAGRWAVIQQLVKAVSEMPLNRLEAFVNLLIFANGEESDKQAAAADLRTLIEEMRQVAAEPEQRQGSGQWYAMQALNAAKQRGNWLPALRTTGDGTAERKALEAFYAQLRAAGAIQAAAGNQPAKVLDMERAEQVARRMQ